MQDFEVIDVLDEELASEVQEEPARPAPRTRLRRWMNNNRGMTLVEILIVLTILSAIMAVVGVVAFNQLAKAQIKETELRLAKVSNKLQEFYAFNSPPTLPDALSDLVTPPGGERGVFLTHEQLRGGGILFVASNVFFQGCGEQ